MNIIDKIKEYNFSDSVICYLYYENDYNVEIDIKNFRLYKPIFRTNIQKQIYNNNSIFLSYLLERISIYYKRKYDLNSIFDVEICQGYYGPEIGFVSLLEEEIILELAEFASFCDLDMVGYSLKIDNKLPEKKYTSCSIHNLKLKDINLIKTDIKELDQKIVNSYYHYPLPICVVDSDLNIIDGKHRLYAATRQKKKNIDVIILR